MMTLHCKKKIYQGIVQYLLASTNYNLKDIADLTDSSIKTMQSIYLGEQIPIHTSSEYQLVRLYQIILELNLKQLNASEATNEYFRY